MGTKHKKLQPINIGEIDPDTLYPFEPACNYLGFGYQSGLNAKKRGTFPVRIKKLHRRNMVLGKDIIDFLRSGFEEPRFKQA